MAKVPTVETNDSNTLPYSIQCSSDLPHPTECYSEVPAASQLVVVTWKVIEWKDQQGELVIGTNHFTPLFFLDFKRYRNLAK